MTTRRVLRIFIASPSDTAEERRAAEECIAETNGELAARGGPVFDIVRWETVPGTAARPQEAINALIDDCDYMIVLLKSSWGSDPGGTLGYTSGTEEELFTGLQGLAEQAHPLKDVWVTFIAATDRSTEVQELQDHMVQRKALFFEQAADIDEFRTKLKRRLHGWSEVGEKVARTIDLCPRSGRDVLGAARLRKQGDQLLNMGFIDQGLEYLDQAIEKGGPTEELAKARALSRLGRLEESAALVESVLTSLTGTEHELRGPTIVEALLQRAGIMGRNRRNADAKHALQWALELVDGTDAYSSRLRARVLDALGLTRQKLGEHDAALAHLNEALAARELLDEPSLTAQSHVNIARALVARSDLEAARDHANSATSLLDSLPPSPLLANAYLLHAQLRVRSDDYAGALTFAQDSLSLNRQFESKIGESMALNVLGQIYRRLGDDENASLCAQESLALNTAMGVREPPPVLNALASPRATHTAPESGTATP